jgi:molybdate transport system ATP-binding protein
MAVVVTARVRRHVLDVDLRLTFDPTGPIAVLFGPSGAGKTTLLRCLAGLERPDRGSAVGFDGDAWDGPGVRVPARRRRVGYLFQDHALFPHLTVDANVAFGLHRMRRAERAGKVRSALRTAGAEHLAGRRVQELSGGEAQRVALARAIAPEPRLLLLDEPFTALDAPTKARLRTELRHRLVELGIPTIVVTHDRTEALALGDRIAVLIEGRLRQVGRVDDVFSRPVDSDVARTVDVETVAVGTVRGRLDGLTRVAVEGVELVAAAEADLGVGDRVLVCIRAEEVALQIDAAPERSSPRNQLRAAVTDVHSNGPLLKVDLDAGFPLSAYVTRLAAEELDLRPGAAVVASVKAPAVHLVPRD